jgi:hypothetical protein
MPFQAARWIYMDHQGEELPMEARSGYAYLVLEIGSATAYIPMEQRYLDRGFMAVFLGAEFEEAFHLQVPALGSIQAHTIKGFTDDPDVVALTLEFRQAVRSNTFAPQIIVARR